MPETRTYEDGLVDGANLAVESVTSHLTDEALAAVDRLHALLHPDRADGGVYEPARNPGGCDRVWCGSVLPEITAHAEPMIRADERARLVCAGRLLPDGGETRTEWEVRWYSGPGDGIRLHEQHHASRESAMESGPKRIGRYGITRYSVHRREHLIFEDGSSWSGPWVEVTDA